MTERPSPDHVAATCAHGVGTARAIERAVLDSHEDWFAGDPERMRRALPPELVTRGAGGRPGVTTAEQMIATALWRPA